MNYLNKKDNIFSNLKDFKSHMETKLKEDKGFGNR